MVRYFLWQQLYRNTRPALGLWWHSKQTGMAELGLLEEDINEIHLPAFTASKADLHFLYQAKATAQMLILSCWLCSVLDLQDNSK